MKDVSGGTRSFSDDMEAEVDGVDEKDRGGSARTSHTTTGSNSLATANSPPTSSKKRAALPTWVKSKGSSTKKNKVELSTVFTWLVVWYLLDNLFFLTCSILTFP